MYVLDEEPAEVGVGAKFKFMFMLVGAARGDVCWFAMAEPD